LETKYKSEWRKEKESLAEKREIMWTLAFAVVVFGYFGAHLVAYLIAN